MNVDVPDGIYEELKYLCDCTGLEEELLVAYCFRYGVDYYNSLVNTNDFTSALRQEVEQES